MKRILILMPSMNMGGAEKSLLSFLNEISKEFIVTNEIQIDLLVANEKGVLMNQVPHYVTKIKTPYILKLFSMSQKEAIKESVFGLDGFLLKLMWMVRKKISYIEGNDNERYWASNKCMIPKLEKEYDVCLAYMNGLITYYGIEKVRAKKKYVWVHNEYDKLNYTDIFQKTYFYKADGIITISERCVESLVSHFPEFKKKIYMIENITSPKVLDFQAADFYPKEYVNEKRVKVLSVGRLSTQKGFDIGIKAMKILKERGKSFVWSIIGEGEEHKALSALITESGLEEEIELLGIRSNPYPYIFNCDVFFQPSRFEGKSITLDEAKILSKPIVVSNYDTVYDSIIHNYNGVICNLDAQCLADGLDRVISSTELRQKLSANLQAISRGNVQEIQKYYKLMLGESPQYENKY